jgi:hypothetical protein
MTAVLVGNSLFWVNHSEYPASFEIEGRDPVSEATSKSIPLVLTEGVLFKVRTETTLPEPSELDTIHLTNRTRFDAPPMSFGYVRPAMGRAVPK